MYNQIQDITPLSSLTSLTWLSLAGNQISNLSPLSGLTDLTTLDLRDNLVTDVSHLSGLSMLSWLSLYANQVIDISPVVANAALGAGDFVDLSSNRLGGEAIDIQVQELQSRGVTVLYTPPIRFGDINLVFVVLEALGRSFGDILYLPGRRRSPKCGQVLVLHALRARSTATASRTAVLRNWPRRHS
jgi:hypothetical protein